MRTHLEDVSRRITKDLKKLDTERAQERYKLRKISVYGDAIYVCSKQDEWYIRKTECGQLRLWHRNTWKKQSEFHKEHIRFRSVFEILEYIQHHDKKIYGNGHRGVYTKTHIEKLFDNIESPQKNSIKNRK